MESLKAEELLENALKKNHTIPDLLLARAYVLLKAGKNKLALIKLEETKKKSRSKLRIQITFGESLYCNKDFKKKNSIIDELISKHPEKSKFI